MPLVTTNLRADYDIDALGLSDGTVIASCPDQTANARDLTGPSSHQPTSESSSGPKGKKYAHYTGSQILKSTATDVGPAGTAERIVFAVFRMASRTPSANNIAMYGPAGSGGASFSLGTQGGNDNVEGYFWSLNSSTFSVGDISQWHIVALQINASGNPKWWIDGTAQAPDSGVFPNTTADIFAIGGFQTTNGDLVGDVARVLVHGALSDADIANQFAYLTDTYVTTFLDVATRFSLQTTAPAYADVHTRLGLAAPSYHDVATRLHIAFNGVKDVATRFNLGTSAVDVATRLGLMATGYRDVLTRLKVGLPGYRDVATRLVLSATHYHDLATRFNLGLGTGKDVATRLALRAVHGADLATRFNLVTQAADVLTRLVMHANAWRDATTRFKLWVENTADVHTRLVMLLRAYRDVHTRFKLVSALYHDVLTRLQLKVGWDVATRFNLAATFYGLEQPHGLLDTPINDTSDPVTFDVSGVDYFRKSNGFRIRIGDEILRVIAGADGTSWMALRGQDGTDIAAHSIGDRVEQWTLFSLTLNYFGFIYVHTWDAQKLSFTRVVNGGDGEAKWHIDMPRPLLIPHLGAKVMISDDDGTQWIGRLEEVTGDFYPDYASLDFVARGYASQATDLPYQPPQANIFTLQRSMTVSLMFNQVATTLLSGVNANADKMEYLGRTLPADSQDYANQTAQSIFNSLSGIGNVGDLPVIWGIRSFGLTQPFLELFQDREYPTYYVNSVDCTMTTTSWRLTDVFNSVLMKYALGQFVVRSTAGVVAIGGAERQLVVDYTDKVSSIGLAQYYANTLLEKHSKLRAQGVQITIPYPSPVYLADGVTRVPITQLQYGRRITVLGMDIGDDYFSVESQLIQQYTWDDDRRTVTIQTQRIESIIDILDKILNPPDTLASRPPDPGNRVTPPKTDQNPPVTVPPSSNLPKGGIDGPGGLNGLGAVQPFIDPATGRLAGPANTPGFDVTDIAFAIGVPDTGLEANKTWGPAIIDFKCRVVGLRIRALNQDGDYSGSITLVISKQTNAASAGAGDTIKTITLDGNGYLEQNWAADVVAGNQTERFTTLPAHSALYYTVTAVSGHKTEQVTIALMVRRDPDVGDATQNDTPADTTPPFAMINEITNITTYTADLHWATGAEAVLDSDGNETTPATGEVSIGWIEFGFERPDFNYATISKDVPIYNDAYGSSMPADGTFKRDHFVKFSGLAPGIKYHYRIQYFDRNYNQARTEDGSFTAGAGS